MGPQELTDLCQTYLYFEARGAERQDAFYYLIEKAGNPDEGSKFERKTGCLSLFFGGPLMSILTTPIAVKYMKWQGYDALLLRLHGEIRRYTAFQVHDGDSLHIFSVELDENYREMGLAQGMVESVLKKAREKNLKSVRIGGGGSEATNRIHKNCSERAEELGIVARDDNWVDILYD